MSKNLSLAHQKFIEHYSEYGNATQAYISAYPEASYNSAKNAAKDLLKREDIAEAIEAKKSELSLKFSVSKEQMIIELREAAEQARAAGSMGAYAKIKDMLIKMFGYYMPTNVDITSKGEKVSINLNLSDEDEDETPEENSEKE